MSMGRSSVSAQLLRIHQQLESALASFLERVIQLYRGDPELAADRIRDFTESYGLRIKKHLVLEERAIFPYLRGEPLIDELLKEHRVFRKLIDSIIEKGADPSNPEEIIKELNTLYELLKDHSSKENTHLIKLVETKLTEEQMKEAEEKIRSFVRGN